MGDTEKEQGLTPADKAKATRAAKAGHCAQTGCGHKREEHDANLTTCWAENGRCPCRGYRHPKDEDVDG